MIPVRQVAEPPTFDKKVRQRGREYLKRFGIQKEGDHIVGDKSPWGSSRSHFWKKCITDLFRGYREICCYTAMRVNREKRTNNDHCSVEHFVPKSINPWLAYEWSNYRLASVKANNDRNILPVIDPFLVQPDEFRLRLETGELYPNPDVSYFRKKEINKTIDNIKLNQLYWKKLRVHYYQYYLENLEEFGEEAMEAYLQENAPIVLAELKRPIPPIIIEED